MQCEESADSQKDLYTLVEELTTSGEKNLDEKTLKSLKNLCKKSSDNIRHVFHLLMTQLEKEHAEIRLSSFQIMDELFNRAQLFRQLVDEEFHRVLELTVETNKEQKLPPPQNAANHLKSLALARIESWHEKFGSSYKKIELGYSFLKRVKKVDFAGIRSRTELDRRRQDELRNKQAQIELRAVEKVIKEIKLMEEEMNLAITQAQNCINLIFPRPGETQEGCSLTDGEDKTIQKPDYINDAKGGLNSSFSEPQDESVSKLGSEHGIISRSYTISIQLPSSKMDIEETEDNTDLLKNLKDIINEIKIKFLPMVNKWINILSKSSKSQQQLAKLINLKTSLKELSEKYEEINITLMKTQNCHHSDEDSEDEIFEDVPESENKEILETTGTITALVH